MCSKDTFLGTGQHHLMHSLALGCPSPNLSHHQRELKEQVLKPLYRGWWGWRWQDSHSRKPALTNTEASTSALTSAAHAAGDRAERKPINDWSEALGFPGQTSKDLFEHPWLVLIILGGSSWHAPSEDTRQWSFCDSQKGSGAWRLSYPEAQVLALCRDKAASP